MATTTHNRRPAVLLCHRNSAADRLAAKRVPHTGRARGQSLVGGAASPKSMQSELLEPRSGEGRSPCETMARRRGARFLVYHRTRAQPRPQRLHQPTRRVVVSRGLSRALLALQTRATVVQKLCPTRQRPRAPRSRRCLSRTIRGVPAQALPREAAASRRACIEMASRWCCLAGTAPGTLRAGWRNYRARQCMAALRSAGCGPWWHSGRAPWPL